MGRRLFWILGSFAVVFTPMVKAQNNPPPSQPNPISIINTLINPQPTPPTGSEELPLDIQIVLDVSGSMNAALEGVKKIDAARSALATALADIPPDTPVAFRAHGHTYPKEQRELSCKDSKLVLPYGPVNKESFMAIANILTPNGMTPTAYSLQLAGEDLKARGGHKHMIILISDGEETCGGDAVAVLQQLKAQGVAVNVYPIGFAVGDQARNELMAIANATGGQYFDAGSVTALAQSLKVITQEKVPQKKAITHLVGEARVKGGDNYETSVPYPAQHYGREVSFVDHIKGQAPEFFHVDLKAGQALRITGYNSEKAIGIDAANIARDSTHPPVFTMLVEDANRRRVTNYYFISPNQFHERYIEGPLNNPEPQNTRYYILVGSKESNADIHKDARLKVEVVDQTDAGTGLDAPDDLMNNPPGLPLDQEVNGTISRHEDKDVYKISGLKAGQKIAIQMTPVQPTDSIGIGALFDANRVDVLQDRRGNYSPNPGAPAQAEVLIPRDGDYFVRVQGSLFKEGSPYRLVARLAAGAVASDAEVVAKPIAPPPAEEKTSPVSIPEGTLITTDPSQMTTWDYFSHKPVLYTVLIQAGIIALLLAVVYFLINRRPKI